MFSKEHAHSLRSLPFRVPNGHELRPLGHAGGRLEAALTEADSRAGEHRKAERDRGSGGSARAESPPWTGLER